MSVIFVGPKLNPVTGQSLAFHNLTNNYHNDKLILEYGGRSLLFQILSIIYGFFKMLYYLMFNKCSTMYITTSRSKFGFFRDFLFINLANYYSLNIVNHLHGADFKDFYLSLHPWLKKIVYKTYCKVSTSIVLLPKMKEQYDMFDNMQVVAVDNGCAFPKIIPDFNDKKHKQILYLSNVMYSKGITFLIDAVDIIKKQGIDIKLVITGNILGDNYMSKNEMTTVFYEKIRNKKYIEYVGPVSGKIKENLLHESLYFVLPSFYKTEAQPLSLIEAMFNGCICITTNHNYLSDMVSVHNGCIVRTENFNDISDYIISNIEDREYQGKIFSLNVDYSYNRFSLDKHINKIISLL